MTITAFSEAQQHAKAADRSLWLGSLVWYAVNEGSVLHSKVAEILKGVGLEDLTPRAPRDEDVFRRVCPNGQRKQVSTTNDEIHVNYLIRPVSRGGGSCTKHIVAETVDSAGLSLEYEEVYELTYDGDAKRLVTKPLTYSVDETARELAEDISRQWGASIGRIDANALRRIVAKAMEQARATSVRPNGGVYFVSEKYASIVDALEAFSAEFSNCTVHSLPLLDDGKQREMLRRAYEADTIEEVERSLKDISGMLASPDPVTADQYARMSARFAMLLDRNEDYVHLLEDTLDNTASKLSIYRQQMAQLLRKVS